MFEIEDNVYRGCEGMLDIQTPDLECRSQFDNWMDISLYKEKSVSGDITRKLTTLTGNNIEVTYSIASHKTTVYVLDINGDKKAVKQENMPKELRGQEIDDPIKLLAYLKDASVRVHYPSDDKQGEPRLDVIHGLYGGMMQAEEKVALEVFEVVSEVVKAASKVAKVSTYAVEIKSVVDKAAATVATDQESMAVVAREAAAIAEKAEALAETAVTAAVTARKVATKAAAIAKK